MQRFSKTVYLLAAISLCTDVAGEMLYPIIPLYLSQLGYGLMFVGALEGVAQLTIGLVRLFSGAFADQKGSHIFLVRLGYVLAAGSRPIIGFTSNFWTIFSLRILDRTGKGLRGTPRDALLARESVSGMRASTFGFHRAMDTTGAVLGPLITIVILSFLPGNLQAVFFATIIPGTIAIVLVFLLKKPSYTEKEKVRHIRSTFRDVLVSVWVFLKRSPIQYRKLLAMWVSIALLKSTEMFLLLRAKELGLSTREAIIAYVLFNASNALLAYRMGRYADNGGFRKITAIGIVSFSLAYAMLALNTLPAALIFATFILYGIFLATYDGMSEAWLTLMVSKEDSGTALGAYHGAQAVAALLGSLVVGALWTLFGATLVFAGIATLALLLLVMIVSFRRA